VGLIGFVMPDEVRNAMIVTEWMPNGSLEDLMRDLTAYARLTPTQKVKIVIGICKGMGHIHALGGMHRDLKPANILLDANYEIRIADFGSSKFSTPDQTLRRTAGMGTPVYMAPEAINDNYDASVDVFSFAMMLWEIATGKSLVEAYKGEATNAVRWFKFVENRRPAFDGINAAVQGIIECCWDNDPASRLGWSDILDYLEQNQYDLVGPVDQAAVREYLGRITLYEEEFPPRPLDED
jgi:serine/threonine protein kinase